MKTLFLTITFLFVFVFPAYTQIYWDNNLLQSNHKKAKKENLDYLEEGYDFPSKFFLSTFFLKKKDSKEKLELINPANNISFGIGIYSNTQDKITDYDIDHIIFGITLEDAILDFRKDGFTPVEDSIFVSNVQFFTRIYNKKGIFIGLLAPVNHVRSSDKARVVIGYSYPILKSISLDLNYRFLLQANKDGFRKGMLTLGLSNSINIKL